MQKAQVDHNCLQLSNTCIRVLGHSYHVPVDEEQGVAFKDLLTRVQHAPPSNLRKLDFQEHAKVDYVYRCMFEASGKARFQALQKVWSGA